MPRLRPTREEFKVRGNEVEHLPTRATWTMYPERHLYRQCLLGSVLPNGNEYREDEVTIMALELLAEQPR
jgi:hypothetical protein